MNNNQLTEALRAIGIEPDRIQLMSLLPLVQVAWADGEIQEAERDMILGVARKYELLQPEDEALLRSWLQEAPSPYFQTQARKIILHLSSRDHGALDRETVVGWCWRVASAAGGLFGTRILAISGGEQEALEEIATMLKVHEIPPGWTELSLDD